MEYCMKHHCYSHHTYILGVILFHYPHICLQWTSSSLICVFWEQERCDSENVCLHNRQLLILIFSSHLSFSQLLNFQFIFHLFVLFPFVSLIICSSFFSLPQPRLRFFRHLFCDCNLPICEQQRWTRLVSRNCFPPSTYSKETDTDLSFEVVLSKKEGNNHTKDFLLVSILPLVRKTNMLAANQHHFNWALHCAPNNTTGNTVSKMWVGIRLQAVQHVYGALSLGFSQNLLWAAVCTNTTQEALEIKTSIIYMYINLFSVSLKK